MKNVGESEKLVKKTLNTFFLLFLFLGAFLGGMILAFYHLQTNTYEKRLCEEEQHSIELQRAVIDNHFMSVTSDLMFLAKQADLTNYLLNPSGHRIDIVKQEYLTLSTSKRIYDQVRFLDKTGQELARVNFNAGNPTIVANQSLQNKKQRYYFRDTFNLEPGEVFISPLDLNVEHGEVEVPYKPMIRFGTPVCDSFGNKEGIVLLNYLAEDLLRLIQNVGSVARGQTMLLNAEGYWLKHPDANKEWGFMFKDKAQVSLAKQNPLVWQQFLAAPSGQLKTPQGIYTFNTINPGSVLFKRQIGLTDGVTRNAEVWKIVSFISDEALSIHSQNLLVNLFALGAGLFLVAAIAAWYLAMAITRRKIYQAQLFSMAHFDHLTGLANRALFIDRLTQALQLAKRHKRQCALLYIDLDGFKNVNDSLGHDAGDELLAAVAKRMVSCCRASDTVSRLGGDEFAIILTEVSCEDGAQIFTKKILSSLALPFLLKGGETKIGASIGIVLWPTHGSDLDELLKNADQAMYLSKNRGKNTFTFAATVNADK